MVISSGAPTPDLRERLLGHLEDPRDVGLAESRRDEPVVVRVEIYAMRRARRGEDAAPLEGALVRHEGHERDGRRPAVADLEMMRRRLPLDAGPERAPDLCHVRDRAARLELLQTGDCRRHRHRAGPERAREEHPHRRLAQRLAPEAGGDRVAVAERLRVAREVGLHADVLARAAEVKPEAGAHVVQDEDRAEAVRTLPQPGEEPGRRHLLVVEDVVTERLTMIAATSPEFAASAAST